MQPDDPGGPTQAAPPRKETVGSRRVLVLGWSSVLHGEATAGDVLSMQAVADALTAAGVAVDIAWSAVMRPPGGLALADADAGRYSHVVWACGPLHGDPVREVLDRFAGCVRVAVGVSVLDGADPAVTGWDAVLPRDAPGRTAVLDLAARHRPGAVPVLGVYLAPGQDEYAGRRRHEQVTAALEGWLTGVPAACLPLDTRLDPRSWRSPSAPEQVTAVLPRLDAVVTMRLHGLVLALAAGVPAVAVDPVAGGGKVSAQAAAWGWPALVPAEEAASEALGRHLTWCLSQAGREAAHRAAGLARGAGSEQLSTLVALVRETGEQHEPRRRERTSR